MRAITENSNGNIYAGASALDSIIYFANDTLFNTISPGTSFSAIFKWDAAGNPMRVVPVYTSGSNPSIYDMNVNGLDEILFTLNAETGPVVINNIRLPLNDFLIKLDTTGNVAWYKTSNNNNTIRMGNIKVRNGNEYILSGAFNTPLNCGCIAVSSGSAIGNLVALISEHHEPVPLTGFTYLQSGNTFLFKDTSQNETSLQWSFGDATTDTLKQPIHTYTQPGIYNACISTANNCGTSQLCKTITVKGIRAIITNHGGNNGIVTAEIFGAGFTSNTSVLLKRTGNSDIVPYATTFLNSEKLSVRLNFTGQTPGLWDVEVTIPADTIMTLANGFELEPTSNYRIEITNSGPSESVSYRWFSSQFTIHNNSNRDAVGVPVIFRINETLLPFVNYSFIPVQQIPFLNSGYQYITANSLNPSLENFIYNDTATDSKIGAFIIPLIKANSSFTLPLYLNGSVELPTSKIILAMEPLLASSALTGSNQPGFDFCFGSFLRNAFEKTFSIAVSPVQWNNCFPALYDSLLSATSVRANDIYNYSQSFSLPASIVSMTSQIASAGCITGVPTILNNAQIESIINKTLGSILFGIKSDFIVPNCPLLSQFRSAQHSNTASSLSHLYCESFTNQFTQDAEVNTVLALLLGNSSTDGTMFSHACIDLVQSSNPDRITGTGNNVDDIFQKPGEISSYTVSFENPPAATAPAKVVMITDTLENSRFDFRTFRFSSVTIGNSFKLTFNDPEFSLVNVSALAPFSPVYLRTEATFDTTTGIIRWIFTKVDSTYYQPDTIAGFLPPNANGTEGTGYVSYEVKLKTLLSTGDSVLNKAMVVIDNLVPLVTNEWLNVIDITKPMSTVNTLLPNSTVDSFLVTWSGTDLISGIRAYNVYVSVNDQPYQLWIGGTDTTRAMYHGIDGYKYEFFSKSLDRAGNVEDTPVDPANFPDAVTMIITGIKEISGDLKFYLSPNPVRSELIIHSFDLISEIKCYDVMGKEVYATQLLPAIEVKLPTSDFAQGVYMLEVLSQNKKGYSRFIKAD